MDISTLKKLELNGHKLYLEEAEYENNGAKALLLLINDEEYGLEPFIDITTNIDGYFPFDKNEVLVKTWNENESFIEPLLKTDLFEDTGRRIQVSQWCEAAIWTYKG